MLIPGTCWPSLLPKEPSKFNRRSFRASLLLALAPRKEQRPQSYASPMQMPNFVQVQPEAVVSMSLRVDPLNVEGKLRDEKGQRDWNSGLFGCCTSPHDLALSVFCPCLVYGQTKDRLNDLNAGKSASDPACCPGGGWVYGVLCVFTGLGCCLDWGLRRDIRARYDIAGGGSSDGLVATFCCVCNQVQSAREVQQELDFLHQEGPAPQSTRAERVRASVQV